MTTSAIHLLKFLQSQQQIATIKQSQRATGWADKMMDSQFDSEKGLVVNSTLNPKPHETLQHNLSSTLITAQMTKCNFKLDKAL